MRLEMVIREGGPEDAPLIANVQIKSWRYAYKGIIDQNYLDECLDRDVRMKVWQDTLTRKAEGMFLAFEATVLAGFAFVGKSRNERYQGYAELYAIYLDPDFMRQGVGKGLFQQVSAYVVRRGFRKMFVKVLTDNKVGRDFYERMGGIVVSESEDGRVFGGKFYPEIRYVWGGLGF